MSPRDYLVTGTTLPPSEKIQEIKRNQSMKIWQNPKNSMKNEFYIFLFVLQVVLVIFPCFSRWIRPFSAVSRAENVLLRNLRKIIDERRKNYDENRKVDLIQLLLQQDQIRQHTEGVKN
jgi:hypothetical protein